MVGLFPFVSMFLVTSIAMLRGRTSGTLERVMASPIAKANFLSALAAYGDRGSSAPASARAASSG